MTSLWLHRVARPLLLSIPLVTAGVLWLALSPVAAEAAEVEADAVALQFVAEKVKPILQARCHECHGPESEEPGGGLRLDSRATALLGGDTGPAIVPGNPIDSMLIESIEYRGEYEMPPDSKMPAGEVAVLAKWIEMGAPWPADDEVSADVLQREAFPMQERLERHWVWKGIQHRDPPEVKHTEFARTPIDKFVAAKLEEQGLAPSEPAGRRTLLRRAWFDLLGLPPSEQATDAFLNDSRATSVAFESVVDELLASPRFGERWARHWLDLVRYAETGGHEYDYPIYNAYQYRDYVIRALNADVPYDQFVTEHVAGDLLKQPRRHPEAGYNESIIGTGFWYFFEGQHAPVDARGDELRVFGNQIDVFSKTFLGMTVACAQCHDHKFDAITMADYYGLAGYLKSSRRQDALLDPYGKITEKREQLAAIHEESQQAFTSALPHPSSSDGETFAGGLLMADAKWQAALADPELDRPSHPLYGWKKLAAAEASEFAATRKMVVGELAYLNKIVEERREKNPLIEGFDGGSLDAWFNTGYAFTGEPTRSGEWDPTSGDASTLPPGMVHSGLLSNKLQGVLRSPTFTIKDKQLLYRVAGRGATIRLIIDGYTLDQFNTLLFRDALFEVETDGEFIWYRQGQDVSNYVGHRAHIEIIDHGDGFVAVDEIRFSDGSPPPPIPNQWGHDVLADESVTSLADLAARYESLWQAAYAAWRTGTADKTQDMLVSWAVRHGLLDIDLSGIGKQLAATSKEMREVGATLPAPMRVLAKTEGTPEDEFVLIRGNHRTPGDQTPRRLLEAITGNEASSADSGGRLDLASRLVDSKNPLTSRVMVNRMWHFLFGRGIAPSVDNLGELGQAPTHPELLDHLANRFVANDWSIKRTLREIMLSSTYQMSSKPTSEHAEEVDPTNALLHRQRVRRLQGEAIRDAMLSISGRLDTKMYGRGVPIHLTTFMDGRGRPDKSGPLDGNGRRSIYIEVRRNFLSPMMIAFDTPIPFGTVGRRNVSNVPAQPLILLNDPFVYQQAQVWAKQSLSNADLTMPQRIEQLYDASFSRPPSEQETAAALGFLESQAEQLGLEADAWRTDARVWADLCHVLWNVKEFIYLH